MPKLLAVFRKKRDRKLSSYSSSGRSGEPVDASTQQCTLQVTPGGAPSWASQPWHYVFQVSTFLKSEITIHPIKQDGDEAWAQGLNGRWRLVTVIGDGFFDNIEVSKCASTVRVLVTQLFLL